MGAEDGTSPCSEQEKHTSFGLEIPLDEAELKHSSEGKQEEHRRVEMADSNQKTELGRLQRAIMEAEEVRHTGGVMTVG